MPITVINGPTIAEGESLSDACDLGGGKVVRITTPWRWENNQLTFQISSNGTDWFDLWMFNEEVTLACGKSRGIVIMRDFPSTAHMKIRAGSAAHPAIQPVSQEFAVAVETP